MDIKKTYDNINRDKILEQLENMGIQGRMLRFIKGLVRVGGSVLQSKQTDLRSPQEGVLSVTLFLVAINGISGELGNRVMDHSLQRNQRVETRVLQGVTNKLDAWAAERGLTFFPNKTVSIIFRKRNEELK